MEPITGQRILVTGVTGWVAGPLATSLAAQGNTVFGAARFRDPAQREPWEAQNVTTVSIDLEKGRLDEVPNDLDLVLHFAVAKSNNFEEAFASNAHGSADLMETAASRSDHMTFFHCSSTAVYAPHDHEPRVETDLLGDSHRPMPGMPTYSISKIAGEVLVQHTAKRLGVPTVIARLNVPYGDQYGWMLFHLMMMERNIPVPVHVDQPTSYTPIHADDIARSIPYLLSYASTPAEIVNWGGDQIVSIEDWCEEMGRLTGLTPSFNPTTATIAAIIPDLSKLHDRGFRTTVDWREGIRRQIESNRPELLKN
ncbi:MAG: NAD(P)-dependent oxidoreductase [Actinomycetota bacterium]|nr:NAD(P)-dependent oxidoreductase [Actinomycetota bacterium]MDA3012108.1 NAD(P)-dependent oxidoreductase [Actinomycetota bacterium]MDA3024843.1 NAD(P)-dependent oxidoreductase [Actinomycetota bacterium]